MMEVAEADVEFARQRFLVKGRPRREAVPVSEFRPGKK
jgi:hypothetical protein